MGENTHQNCTRQNKNKEDPGRQQPCWGFLFCTNLTQPTGNLDYNTSIEIMQLFLELQQEQGHSIIIVTHDAMVAGYTDRILFLHDGQVCDEYRCRKNGDDMDHIVDKFKTLSLKKGR